MIVIDITGINETVKNLGGAGKQIERATERAIDFTAKHIQSDIKAEMLRVFDNPVDYTVDSVKTTLTKGHNMISSVWVATPTRMDQSYLVPQVDGGSRKLKGFERGLDNEEFVPASGMKLNASGNIPVSTIKKSLDGVKRRSAEYVRITERKGKLVPGVYQRIKTTRGFSKKTSRTATRLLQRGRTRGRFASAIIARGIKPIMLEGRTGHAVEPQLDFYGVAHRTFDAQFNRRIDMEMSKTIG